MQACKEISFSLRALRFTATLQGTDIGLVVEHAFGQFTCFSPNRLLLGVLIAFYKSVRLAAGLRVRLPSGLSPFVSLLVGHCVRLVSRFFFLLSPSALSPFCIPLSPAFSSFFSLLLPFASVLVGHCVCLVSLLSPFVSLVGPSCVPSVSFCLPSCWSLCPPCLPSCFPSWSLPLPVVSLLFPFVSLLVGHCVRFVSSFLSPMWQKMDLVMLLCCSTSTQV